MSFEINKKRPLSPSSQSASCSTCDGNKCEHGDLATAAPGLLHPIDAGFAITGFDQKRPRNTNLKKLLSLLFLIMACCVILMASFAQAKSKHPTGGPFDKGISKEERLFRFSQLIASGQTQKANSLFPKIKKFASKQLDENRLSFMEAYLLLQEGKYGEAEKKFSELDVSYTEFLPYVQYFHATTLKKEKKWKKANELLQSLKEKPIPLHLLKQVEADYQLSSCVLGKSDITNPAPLEPTLEGQPQYFELKLLEGQCLLERNRETEAFALLRELFIRKPEGALGDKVKTLVEEKLKNQLSYQDYLSRAKTLQSKHLPKPAAHAMEKALNLAPISMKHTLLAQLGEQYFEARYYRKAGEAYEKLASLGYPVDQAKLASSYSRSDQFSKAIALYQNFYDREPSETLLYKLAFLYEDSGDYKKSIELYLNLLSEYPKTRYQEAITWKLMWNYFRLKNYAAALQWLDALEKDFPRHAEQEGFTYWRARILEKMGKIHEAKALFSLVAKKDSHEYYGYLSLKRLQGNFDIETPPEKVPGIPKGRLPHSFVPHLKDSNNVYHELAALGLWEHFLLELAENVDPSLLEIKNLLRTDLGPYVGYSPSGALRQRFPDAYGALVVLYAQSRSIPPALLWGIMREESRFKPGAMSPANAIGLMQVIPQTAFEICQALNKEHFILQDLLKPAVSIEFGSHYLFMMFTRYKNLMYTIASYNAGPDAVDRWVAAKSGHEWDEFVEEIPYKETRQYVKRVLRSYYTYQLLYP